MSSKTVRAGFNGKGLKSVQAGFRNDSKVWKAFRKDSVRVQSSIGLFTYEFVRNKTLTGI